MILGQEDFMQIYTMEITRLVSSKETSSGVGNQNVTEVRMNKRIWKTNMRMIHD